MIISKKTNTKSTVKKTNNNLIQATYFFLVEESVLGTQNGPVVTFVTTIIIFLINATIIGSSSGDVVGVHHARVDAR